MAESTTNKSGWLARANVLFACGLLSVLPLLVVETINLWNRPHFRYFPLAWLLFVAAIATEPKIGFAASTLRRRVGVGLTLAGLVISFLAAVLISPGLAHVALISLVTGWILVWLGIVPWTRLVALTGLLWITWPWPMDLDGRLIQGLHERAARTVSPLLDLISIPNLLLTNKLDLRGGRIDLAGIVGGWNSVFLLFFCAILLFLLLRRSLAVCVLTLLLTPVLSWMRSVLHILFLAWAQEGLRADWTTGGAALGLNIGLFVLSLVFLWLLIQGLTYLLEPLPAEMAQQSAFGFHSLYNRIVFWPDQISKADEGAEEVDYFDEDESEAPSRQRSVKRRRPPVRLTMKASDPWRGSWHSLWVAGAFLLVAALGAAGSFISLTSRVPSLPSYTDQQIARIASEDSLPPESHGMKRSPATILPPDKDGPIRTHSIIWRYNSPEGAPLLSLEFPFYGEQNRWLLVGAAGWKIKGQPKRLIVEGWPLVEVELENEMKSAAYALYSAFDSSGNPAVPEQDLRSSFQRRLSSTVFGKLMHRSDKLPITFQSQFLLDSVSPPSAGRKSEYQALMVEVMSALKQRVVGGTVP